MHDIVSIKTAVEQLVRTMIHADPVETHQLGLAENARANVKAHINFQSSTSYVRACESIEIIGSQRGRWIAQRGVDGCLG